MTSALVGELELPDHVTGTPDQKRYIRQVAGSLFPFEVDTQWITSRPPYRVLFYRTPQCPLLVPFADWRDEMETYKPGEIFIGLDKRGKPYNASFLTDDPHWGFEVTSRRGKSTFLSVTIAQILHQDPLASATGIDVKRESFKALFGVPRFELYNDPRNIQAMWDAIERFRIEMDKRCDARAKDPGLEFPIAILAIDEVSQFSYQSAAYWREIKEKGDPATPPVWADVAAIMWQGAAFHCHVIIAGQRIDHQITGGLGLIGSMGFLGLAGFRKANWDRLIGTSPVPRSHPNRGRWLYSYGGAETWVQNVWATDAEIKEYAMETKPTAPVIDDPVIAGVEWVTGLQDAANRVGLELETFRKRRQRHPIPGEESRGKRPCWRSTDLNEWAGQWDKELVS